MWNFLLWRKLCPHFASASFQNMCWPASKKSAESAMVVFRLEGTLFKWWAWVRFTHFTLHCYRIRIRLTHEWFVTLAYLCECTCELDIGVFLHCKKLKKFASYTWPMVLWKLGNRWKWKGESWFHDGKVLFVGVVGIAITWFHLVQSEK